MDSHGPSASPHRDGQLVVCRLGSDAVQIANRTIEDVYRQVVTVNRAAKPAPRITEMVSVQDWETKALHLLLVHRLDYRPQGASAVRDVVVFSEPTYAVFRTERLRLATPAYYRGQQDLRPGIRDVHDGTLTKDSIRWANTVVQAGMVTGRGCEDRNDRRRIQSTRCSRKLRGRAAAYEKGTNGPVSSVHNTVMASMSSEEVAYGQ